MAELDTTREENGEDFEGEESVMSPLPGMSDINDSTLQESIEEILQRLDLAALIHDDEETEDISDSASVTSSGSAASSASSLDRQNSTRSSATVSCTGSDVELVGKSDLFSDNASKTNQNDGLDNVHQDRPETEHPTVIKKTPKHSHQSPIKILRRMSQKAVSSVSHKRKSSGRIRDIQPHLSEIKVDSLPQAFVTKYLGARPCSGLWGIKHTRAPVDDLIDAVGKMRKGEDLPLVDLYVLRRGIYVKPHNKNKGLSFEPCLTPIEFISYGVQDNVYARVFAFILVKEMSSEDKVLECHAYVCDSYVTSRRLALSLSLAFQEFAEKIKGKKHRFQVDLRNAKELGDELKRADDVDC